MSTEPHDGATLSRAAHLPPCRPAPTTLASPPPTPPTKPTRTPTARSSPLGAAHRAAAYRAREHLRGPPSGLPSGPKSPSEADSSVYMRTTYRPKRPHCYLRIPPKAPKSPQIAGFWEAGNRGVEPRVAVLETTVLPIHQFPGSQDCTGCS